MEAKSERGQGLIWIVAVLKKKHRVAVHQLLKAQEKSQTNMVILNEGKTPVCSQNVWGVRPHMTMAQETKIKFSS